MSIRLRVSPAGRVFFGEVIYEAKGTYGPRPQHDYQLVMVEEGSAVIRSDDTEIGIAKGEVALLLPGRSELFRFSETRRTHHTWCAIHPALVSPALKTSCASIAPTQRASHRFMRLLEMGLDLPDESARTTPALAESLGLTLLNEFIFHGTAATSSRDEPDAMRRLLAWFGQHAAKPMTLKSLAEVAGVSSAQLVKLCKAHLGTTPMRALWEARTREGERMLADTGLTVSEIAYRCGFQTPFHFSRWMRTPTGRSPRGSRARSWREK